MLKNLGPLLVLLLTVCIAINFEVAHATCIPMETVIGRATIYGDLIDGNRKIPNSPYCQIYVQRSFATCPHSQGVAYSAGVSYIFQGSQATLEAQNLKNAFYHLTLDGDRLSIEHSMSLEDSAAFFNSYADPHSNFRLPDHRQLNDDINQRPGHALSWTRVPGTSIFTIHFPTKSDWKPNFVIQCEFPGH